nr:NADP-specific glutamate dehydrogenase [Tanacetum cinerariifolium]
MNKELKGLRCAVSGSGKIAMHVLEKLIAYGALPITVLDYALLPDYMDELYRYISLDKDLPSEEMIRHS